jgi:hypothetical protein
MESQGMDIANFGDDGLVGLEMAMHTLKSDDWENYTARWLTDSLSNTPTSSHVILEPFFLNSVTNYVSAFKNRKSREGLLQITGFTENPRGVKLRYKLVQQAAAISTEDDLTFAEQPPVVVETFPVSGTRDAPPGETEIRVRFSKPMTDGSWSWCTAWENSTPEFIGDPHYEKDGRTCALKVKLETGRTYAFWLNSEKFNNFTDHAGQPAVPYLLIFQTKSN